MRVIKKGNNAKSEFSAFKPGELMKDEDGSISIKTDDNNAVRLSDGALWFPAVGQMFYPACGAFVEGYGS